MVLDPSTNTWFRTRRVQLVQDTSFVRRGIHLLIPDGSLRLRTDIHGVEGWTRTVLFLFAALLTEV
jgi:hypothetical protein